jgi:hypothetical protein
VDLSREVVEAELARLGSRNAVARAYGIAPSTLARHMKRLGIVSPHPRTPIETDTIESSSELVVEWGKYGSLTPARSKGWQPSLPKRPAPNRATQLVLCVSDTHAPYHDPGLHDCLLQWLYQHQPEQAFDFGDMLDLPTPSRHRTTRGFEATPQESLNARYELDAERVAASPRTQWTVCLGNHDERLDHAIRDKVGAHVARIARAGDDVPVMDLGFLLRYDELGIDLARPSGDYHSVTLEIAPGLHARHGTKAGKHGGAVKAIEKHAGSVAQGHDHRQVLQQIIKYDEHGIAQARWAISFGAMCSRDLGYVEDPDVGQGFLTVTVHDDGSWHPELARYDAATKRLFWRNECYTAKSC